MNHLTLLLFFVLAALADIFSVAWHSAREQKQLIRVGLLAGILEILTWVPLYVAITQKNVWIILVSVIGSIIGSMIGTWRSKNSTS